MKQFYFPYEWQLKTGYPKEKNGYSVFSCFACGGGSTMGYKLSGYNVLGFNEIDPKIAECYIKNHNPKYQFIEQIQDFKNKNDLPKELFNLDILDGSPPCSSFSICGNRDKDWGKKKKFKEGQQKQILDTLFFDFIDLAEKLQPKIVISENVPGILMDSAFKYVQKIYSDFKKIGYYTIHRILDASKMGVPQKRKRVFFFSIRKDLIKNIDTYGFFNDSPKIDLMFNSDPILFNEIKEKNSKERPLKNEPLALWRNKIPSDVDLENISKRNGKPNIWFGWKFIKNNKIPNTIIANDNCCLYSEPRYRSKTELLRCGSFPFDYNFLDNEPQYLIGMSVPPVMMAQISKQVQIQWLDKIYNKL